VKKDRFYSQDLNSPHWETPQDFYNKLNKEFNFNDDPCPLYGCRGLQREWGSRTFVNPPYGDPIETQFIKKAIEESQKGKLIVMLLKAATDTKRFHNLILPYAKEIRFIKGRLHFQRHDGKKDLNHRASFPSMLVIFNSDNISTEKEAGL
jgi:site-specific DNA-methyltransferase (adenine-specific)